MTRPRFWLHLTTGLTVDRRLSPAAKYRAAIAAALARRDPSTRLLTKALRVEDKTLARAAAELERLGLARLVRRPGRRLAVHPTGLAAPAKTGRQRFAMMPPDLFYAALDAGSGRSAVYGPLVIQRLLREQTKRGAAHVSPLVIAADLDLRPKLVLALLEALVGAGVIDRHGDHPLDTDELRVYTVPLATTLYPIDTAKLDPEQTRLIEHVQIGAHELTVIGRTIDFNLLALRLSAVDTAAPNPAITDAVARAVTENLTGETILAEDLLRALGPALSADSPDTSPTVRPALPADSPDTSTAKAEAEAHYALTGVGGGELQGYTHGTSEAPAESKGKTVDEESGIDLLPRSVAAVKAILEYVPGHIANDLANVLAVRQTLSNDGAALTAHQLALVDDFLTGHLRALADLPDDPRQRFAVIRHALKTAGNHDELHVALKRARPQPDLADDLLGQLFRQVET